MSLIVEVRRDLYTKLSTQGKLAIDSIPQCFTLEPAAGSDEIASRTPKGCIPCGTYPLTIRWSPKRKAYCPHIEDVPGFDAIEQHIGNFPKDTDGCTLVGKIRGPQPDFIGMSLLAYTALMAKYMAAATLRNPEAPEKDHIWDVGQITFSKVELV
jgi:Steigviridae/Suoliviridae L,D-carboxypeptidase/transpeptidase